MGNNCNNTSLVFSCFVLHFFCSLITITALPVPHWSVRKMGIRDKIPRKNDVFSQLFTDLTVENQTDFSTVCVPEAKMSSSSFFGSGISQKNLKIRKNYCIVVACMTVKPMSKAQTGNKFTVYENRKRDVCSSLATENASHFIQILFFFFLIAPPHRPESSSGNKLHHHNYLC